MPNIFGTKDKYLSNPLSEDLLADNFNALNFNEVHLNELHDNSGTGKIVVHEEFNMTNNRITNMSDPVAGKDAVTLDYYESNLPPTPTIEHPYDLYVAMTDETTAISNGFQPVTFQSTRLINITLFKAFLTSAPTNDLNISLYASSNLIATATIIAGDVVSNNVLVTGQITFGEILEVNCNISDATAKGLKVLIQGYI